MASVKSITEKITQIKNEYTTLYNTLNEENASKAFKDEKDKLESEMAEFPTSPEIGSNKWHKKLHVKLAIRDVEKKYGPEGKFSDWPDFTKEQTDLLIEKRQEMLDKIKVVTRDLKRVKITLYRQCFRFGFSFSYAVTEDGEYICVSHNDYIILRINHESDEMKDIPNFWPLKQNEEYFVPEITEIKFLDPPSGSMPTEQYVDQLCRYPSGNARKILQCLHPYAEQLYCSSPITYYRVLEYVDNFPVFNYKKLSF